MNKIRKAVIPVAGFGTRFLPATIAQPKEMLPVVDKPVIQYIVEEMVASGIKEIIFVTGRGKRAIEDHFDYSAELEQLLEEKGKKDLLEEIRRISSLAKFIYVRQNKPLGNGHALLCAKEIIGNEPFAFSYGDDIIASSQPATLQMIGAYEKYQDLIMGVVEVPPEKVSSYGIVRPASPNASRGGTKDKKVARGIFEITGVVEKPNLDEAPSRFANPGRYIFYPEKF
jgi:UTP--glucose-1-phosphate uridylyltransferase